MAEWIKVCKDTPDKPEFAKIARLLNISRESAFAWWFRVYAWADSQTADGLVRDTTAADVAAMTNTPPKFCQLLGSEAIGWMVETEDGDILFRHWDRHNGKSAKQRAEACYRMAKYRAKSQPKRNKRATKT